MCRTKLDPAGIPSFRIVNAKAEPAGEFAFGGSGAQAKLLETEAIKVVDGFFYIWVDKIDTRKELVVYGIERGEFRDVDADEIVNVILYSYQGVRMWSRIVKLKPKTICSITNHIKKQLTGGNR